MMQVRIRAKPAHDFARYRATTETAFQGRLLFLSFFFLKYKLVPSFPLP